jgi:hypothetical protein
MYRRDFLLASGLTAAAAQASGQPPTMLPVPPDSLTDANGLTYYLLGNGLITVGLQAAPSEAAGTNGGLVVMSPDHMNRKTGSLVWNPRTGLQATRSTVLVDGKAYLGEPGRVEITWQYPDGIPTVRLRWQAGATLVTEDLYCPMGVAALIRAVTVVNNGTAPAEVLLRAGLRPNPVLFDEYEVDRTGARLVASGYHRLELSALAGGRTVERDIEVSLGTVAPGDRGSGGFVLALDAKESAATESTLPGIRRETAAYWSHVGRVETGSPELDHMFRAAAHGFRAVVARSGKMDGGIWQYNLEWPRDAAMVASGAIRTGLADVGEAILERILTRMVTDDGAALDSSFHRPKEVIELDQNGELVCSLWNHWVWTGNDRLIRTHWKRIRAAAGYALDPFFRDASTGLLKNSREFWERGPIHGVLDGYELACQAWNIVGWERAADLATLMGDGESAGRWKEASALMRQSFLSHPRYSLIEDGKFIKRRHANGDPQLTFVPPDRGVLAAGMPLKVEPASYINPDAASVFPILLGLVDPAGDVARKTLESVEALWNQRWDNGGYGRYHVTSEPDSPGPWPFATLFITRAWLEAGNSEKVWRSVRWLAGVPGGKSGAWFEFYGHRPSPPLPQVAIIPWIWAEMVSLVVEGLFGVHPDAKGVTIRPRKLEGLNSIRTRLALNGHQLTLAIRHGTGPAAARVNGSPAVVENGALRLARPSGDLTVEMDL